MISVFVDTTATFDDVMMSRTRWMQVLTLCAKGDIRLIVPEVVLRETARHWLEQAATAIDIAHERWLKVAKSRKSYEYLGLEPSIGSLPELAEVSADHEKFYDHTVARLAPLGVEMPGVPAVEVSTILIRDLAGKKPFQPSGKGFRDALVWETLKAIVQDLPDGDTVYFVTNNTDDYCLDGALHPDLQAELAGALAKVIPVPTLGTLLGLPTLTSYVAGIAKSDDELAHYLQAVSTDEPDYSGPTVGDVVRAALLDSAEALVGEEVETENEQTSGLDVGDLHLPSELEGVSIVSVSVREESADWQTYETFEGGTLLLRGEIEAEIEFNGFVYKSDYHLVDEEVGLLDWDWNEHMAEVGLTKGARLIFQVQVQSGQDFVEGCELEGIESLEAIDDDHPYFKKPSAQHN